MPTANRVTPFATLAATEHRGTLMGNRGVLHDPAGRQVRHHVGTRWISCLLEFRGRRREVWSPGRYSELFFLDEATALAAGHRPCAECRRGDVARLREALGLGPRVRLPELDEQLQAERLDAAGDGTGRRQRTHRAEAAGLPAGTMVELGGAPWLVVPGGLRAWSHAGYGEPVALPGGEVTVLTPPTLVTAIGNGYPVPLVDSMARAVSAEGSRPGRR